MYKQFDRQCEMAYAYNPSYSGGREQENCSLRPAQVKSLQDPTSVIKVGMMCPAMWEVCVGVSQSRLALAKIRDPIRKITRAKRAESMD
jgi:hypothetical protein